MSVEFVSAALELYVVCCARIFLFLLLLNRINGFLGIVGRATVSSTLGIFSVLYFSELEIEIYSQQSAVVRALYAIRQLLAAVCFSIPTAIALEKLPTLGRLIDVLRGNQFAESLAPEQEQRYSPLENLAVMIICFQFYSPSRLTELADLLNPKLGETLWNQDRNLTVLIQQTAEIFSSSVLLAAPILIAGLVLDLVFAVFAKLQPNFQATSELLQVKLIALLYIGVDCVRRGFT